MKPKSALLFDALILGILSYRISIVTQNVNVLEFRRFKTDT